MCFSYQVTALAPGVYISLQWFNIKWYNLVYLFLFDVICKWFNETYSDPSPVYYVRFKLYVD